MQPQDATTLRARKAPHERPGFEYAEELGDVPAGDRHNGGDVSTTTYDERLQDSGCSDDHAPESPGGGRRAQQLWRKVKKQYDLVEYHVLPEYLRDNEFILRHYRSDWPLRETFWSMFSIHNETFNIWTHLIGFLIFLALAIYTVWEVPKKADLPDSLTRMLHMPNHADMEQLHVELVTCFPALATVPSFLKDHLPQILAKCIPDTPVIAANSTHQCFMQTMKQELGKMVEPFWYEPATRWPFLVFMAGSMFCLMSSTLCHLFSCHSPKLTYWLYRLDYTGIATMIATSYFPPVYYVFLCQPMWRHIYLTSISVIAIMTATISLLPQFQTAKFRPLRTLAFASMGLAGLVPAAHKIIFFHHEPVCLQTLWYEFGMALFYLVGAAIYVARIPERWKPGMFDIAGHSHQIFHVLVVAGAYTHYRAGLMYLHWRDTYGCD